MTADYVCIDVEIDELCAVMIFTVIVAVLSFFWMYNFFFFNDTSTTEIYTLSLHDALPICNRIFIFSCISHK